MGSKNMTDGELDSKSKEKDIPLVIPEPNTFWKQNAEKLVGESISSVEDTARQFVTITGLLEGIYFHAIAFSDVKYAEGSSLLIYVAPLIFWLLSLIFAVMVLFREKYDLNINSSRDSKEKFEKILERKYNFIKVSGVFLIISFIALTGAILHYLRVF